MTSIQCVKYLPDFLPTELSDNAIENIMSSVDFLPDEKSAIKIFGKVTNIPRKQCAYGDEGTSYKFSGINVDGKTWDDVPVLNQIKEFIHSELKIPVNFVLVNLYKNGDDYIGYHSDDEKDLDGKYPIISLSFGATRSFLVKHKVSGKVSEYELSDNSCILMEPPCQKLYKHSVPKRKKIKKPRINLTFRVVMNSFDRN